MNIKCAKCGQSYEVGAECFGKTVECQCGAKISVPKPTTATEKFVAPKIAKWIYEAGKVLVAAGIVFTIFGIVGVCADGAKKLIYPVVFIGGAIFGVFVMGCGKALEYLAEIAFNTRK